MVPFAELEDSGIVVDIIQMEVRIFGIYIANIAGRRMKKGMIIPYIIKGPLKKTLSNHIF